MFSFWYNLQICNDLCCIKPEENELFTVIADLSDALTILKIFSSNLGKVNIWLTNHFSRQGAEKF